MPCPQPCRSPTPWQQDKSLIQPGCDSAGSPASSQRWLAAQDGVSGHRGDGCSADASSAWGETDVPRARGEGGCQPPVPGLQFPARAKHHPEPHSLQESPTAALRPRQVSLGEARQERRHSLVEMQLGQPRTLKVLPTPRSSLCVPLECPKPPQALAFLPQRKADSVSPRFAPGQDKGQEMSLLTHT